MATNINFVINSHDIRQIFIFGFFGFVISMILTPAYTELAYRGKWWKRMRTTTATGEAAPVYQKLHAAKHERHIPTMAGIIFVITTAIITVIANLSRSQTWLPLAAMSGAGLIGLVDDVINIHSTGGVAGMRAKVKSLFLLAIALVGGSIPSSGLLAFTYRFGTTYTSAG